ncbi:MAG: metal-dependent transcriptional regulator [Ignavibacteria bacterium]|nr:metal-dependent transcriptional regulator [Bacteroidota bacterium]MSQ45895.1 metal-dependent transcriptional regulator [Ignavibacteria bacterium]
MSTVSIENYLKSIYHLQQSGERVFTTSLANRLNIAPASVTEMLQKLSLQGLLVYEKYRGVKLLDKGKVRALKIIRKHRLWEMFLVKHLDFKWDEIHDEAEKFEHIMSDKMEAKIDKLLNFPIFDPHGDPIPDKNGYFASRNILPLTSVVDSKKVKITRLDDSSPKILHWANINKIGLGNILYEVQNNKAKSNLTFTHNNKNILLDYSLANNIYVQEIF